MSGIPGPVLRLESESESFMVDCGNEPAVQQTCPPPKENWYGEERALERRERGGMQLAMEINYT